MTRHAVLVLLAFAAVIIWARACAHPATAGAQGAVYVPIAEQGAPRCNRWRGDDWLPCVLATLTAEAYASRTPRPTATPTRASATWAPAYPEPRPRPLRMPIIGASARGGGKWCSAAPVGGGLYYLAGHCLPAAPWLLRVDGVPVTGWQRDPARDLAQVQAGESGPALGLAVLAPGDALTLRPARGDIPAAFAADAWGRHAGGMYDLATWPLDGGFPVGVACVGAPHQIFMGDSGGGAHRVADGSLGGVIVAAEAWPAESDVWCGAEQVVTIVRVP